MIRQAAQQLTRQTASVERYIPPPVGGLNAQESIADMSPEDALVLDNFFPQPDYVEVRRGYISHATGIGDAVESLMEWAGPAGQKFFAADVNEIYEVTSVGAVGAADVSGLSNGRWQHIMQATTGGNFLLCVNGADAPQNYNGSAWATTPAITGVTATELIDIELHKERVWLVQKDTTDAWYLATQAIGGAATKFPLGSLFKRGGHLLTIGSLTIDGGSGADDYICFISSRGEVATYQGTDPSSGTTWAHIGTYDMPRPLGRRCVMKTGGDLALLTEGGVISLLTMMSLDKAVAERAAITGKIDRLFTKDARSYRDNFGWQMVSYPRSNYILVNVPASEELQQYQYVMNSLTGAWCRFTGMNGGVWATFNDDLYFGGNSGTVWKADSGYQDNSSGYIADLKTAFNFLGSRGRIKHAKMMRTLYMSNGLPGVGMRLNVDFGDKPIAETPSVSPTPSSLWGTEVWGGDWGGGDVSYRKWQGASGIGNSFAARLRVATNGASFQANGFDIIAETGGML